MTKRTCKMNPDQLKALNKDRRNKYQEKKNNTPALFRVQLDKRNKTKNGLKESNVDQWKRQNLLKNARQ